MPSWSVHSLSFLLRVSLRVFSGFVQHIRSRTPNLRERANASAECLLKMLHQQNRKMSLTSLEPKSRCVMAETHLRAFHKLRMSTMRRTLPCRKRKRACTSPETERVSRSLCVGLTGSCSRAFQLRPRGGHLHSVSGVGYLLPEGRHSARDQPGGPQLVAGVPRGRGRPEPRGARAVQDLPAAVSSAPNSASDCATAGCCQVDHH